MRRACRIHKRRKRLQLDVDPEMRVFAEMQIVAEHGRTAGDEIAFVRRARCSRRCRIAAADSRSTAPVTISKSVTVIAATLAATELPQALVCCERSGRVSPHPRQSLCTDGAGAAIVHSVRWDSTPCSDEMPSWRPSMSFECSDKYLISLKKIWIWRRPAISQHWHIFTPGIDLIVIAASPQRTMWYDRLHQTPGRRPCQKPCSILNPP